MNDKLSSICDLGWLSTTTVILIRCSCSGFQSTIPILLRGIPDQHPKLPSVGWRSSVVYGIPLELGEFSWNSRILMFLKGPLNGPTGCAANAFHMFFGYLLIFFICTLAISMILASNLSRTCSSFLPQWETGGISRSLPSCQLFNRLLYYTIIDYIHLF